MAISKFRRRGLLGAVLAAVCLGLGATASFGDTTDTGRQAGNSTVTVGIFTETDQFTDTVQGDYPCFEGVIGTISGTGILSGHYNNSPAIFHFEGTDTVEYRVDFNDGRFAIGVASERLAFSASGGPADIETHTGRDQATVYAADGSVIGTVTIRNVFHVTSVDLNGNGQTDPGEIKATVDQFRVGCP
jgi:hypothetical protein